MKHATGFVYAGYQVNTVWRDDAEDGNTWRTTVYTPDWTAIGEAILTHTLGEGEALAVERIDAVITADALGMDVESAAMYDEVLGY